MHIVKSTFFLKWHFFRFLLVYDILTDMAGSFVKKYAIIFIKIGYNQRYYSAKSSISLAFLSWCDTTIQATKGPKQNSLSFGKNSQNTVQGFPQQKKNEIASLGAFSCVNDSTNCIESYTQFK